MANISNIWANLRKLADNSIYTLTGAGASNGTTGANFAGTGSCYIDTNSGVIYYNIGSKSSPSWLSNKPTIEKLRVDLDNDRIKNLPVTAVEIVPAPGTNKRNVFIFGHLQPKIVTGGSYVGATNAHYVFYDNDDDQLSAEMLCDLTSDGISQSSSAIPIFEIVIS